MTLVKDSELTNKRRELLTVAGALLAGSALVGVGDASAQAAAKEVASYAREPKLSSQIMEGSVKRAQKYLGDKQALAEYQKHLTKMLAGLKAGHDPDRLIQDVVLSDPDARTKLAAFTNVAGAEGVFHLCMITVLATLATGQR